MKVWVTKYSLTKGMEELEGKVSENFPTVFTPEGWLCGVHKPDWHETKEAAVVQVRKMIATKRRSIAKQLAKLDELEAELAEGKPT